MGLLYIAAYLKQHTAHEVEVLDSQAEELSYDELKNAVIARSPDVAGITTLTFTLIDVLKLSKIVKEINPSIKVVLGGPHVNIYPDETIMLPNVDFLILGEGEIVFAEFLEHMDNIEELRKIKGVVFKRNGQIINTGTRELIENLNLLPFPARHLTPYTKYRSVLSGRDTVITTMITSRGCPYKCTFCNREHLGKRFRARSPENVVDEMAECAAMGIKELLVYDDTFTLNRARVISICDEIIKRKLYIAWDIRTRIDVVDEEMLKKMKQANCKRVHYGVEAGTDQILAKLGKGITVAQTKKIFAMTKKVGISTLAYFMIGAPQETRADVRQTMELAKQLDPDYVHFSILIPFPSTPIYLEGLRAGIFKEDHWKQFAADPQPGFKPKYWEENLRSDELCELLKTAYKSFYYRPSYVLKRIAEVRSLGELRSKIAGALKVLKL